MLFVFFYFVVYICIIIVYILFSALLKNSIGLRLNSPPVIKKKTEKEFHFVNMTWLLSGHRFTDIANLLTIHLYIKYSSYLFSRKSILSVKYLIQVTISTPVSTHCWISASISSNNTI